MKIDLEMIGELKWLKMEARKLSTRIWKIEAALPPHCQYCGETNPPNSFYPLSVSGWVEGEGDSVSDLICNDCARPATNIIELDKKLK